ncbi:hypothetical protein DA717_14570, partial [Piscirickettsiaceae bacterium NZ-RLO2]
HANLSGVDLSGMDLTGTDLSHANLSGMDLSGANLSGANLSRVDLSGMDLSGANLTGANLTGANLAGADLAGARLTNADLQGADVDGANLIGADLTGLRLTRSLVARLREQEDENKEDVKNYARTLSLFTGPPFKEKGVDYIISSLLCKDGGRQLKEFEETQSQQFLRIKLALQSLTTTESKRLAFGDCRTLQDLCVVASIRQNGGFFHPKETTTTGEELARLLNLLENKEFKWLVCSPDEEAFLRHIRHYARFMERNTSPQPQRGWFSSHLNGQDLENEKFFSRRKGEDPMLIFKRHLESSGNCDSHSSIELAS